jgi:hypothetical protein
MLASFNRPTGISWAISGVGGSSPEFVTDPAALTNGRPADATRIKWMHYGSGGAATTDHVDFTGPLGKTIKARCCALLLPNIGTAVPAGVKVTFSGKLGSVPVGLNGNAITQRTYLLPNGAAAVHCIFPAVDIDHLIVSTFDDKLGAPWATDEQFIDYGEIWVGEGADFAIAQDADEDLMGGLLQRRSHNNQAWPLSVKPYRSLTVNCIPMPQETAIGPNSKQADFQTVANALSTQKTTVLIPYYMKRGHGGDVEGGPPPVIDVSTIDQQRLARTFILGAPDQPVKMKANGDSYYVSPITFGESPP